MKLTQPLYVVPRFHFWKDFGAGKRRRIVSYRFWKNQMRLNFYREKVEDHTLKLDQLPPGSRIFEAQDFMLGHPDLMPDELKKVKHEKHTYDHPWPFNVSIDPRENQEPLYVYKSGTRFFVPRDDALVMTNTILVDDKFQAKPPFEPTEEHVASAQRGFDWSVLGDASATRLPKHREFPRINIKPMAKYGLTKERRELHVLNSMMDLSQTLMAYHNHQANNKAAVSELLERRNINYPKCNVPYDRDGKKIILNLCIESMSMGRNPIRLLDSNPENTRNLDPMHITPRSWRSILEKSIYYTPDWTFTLPPDAFPHTIQLGVRILRKQLDPDETLARCLVHAFGLTSQFARLRQTLEDDKLSRQNRSNEQTNRNNIKNNTLILNDPLEETDNVAKVNSLDMLPKPVVLQVIGLDLDAKAFHFVRYQLNSLKFDDKNNRRVKNQAWYSGPIPTEDLQEVLRYYLDFQLPAVESHGQEIKSPGEQSDKSLSRAA